MSATDRLSGDDRLVWLGPDHVEPNAVTWEQRRWPSFTVEAAISLGRDMPYGEWTNEDYLLLATPGAAAPAVLAVADGHYGPTAAAVAIDAVDRVLGRRRWTDTSRWALSAALDETIRAAGERVLREAEGSETTLVVALLMGTQLLWASVGDSYLYRFAAGQPPRVLNARDRRWLGAVRNRDPLLLASRGALQLAPGEQLLLATDGLAEPARNRPHLAPDEIEALLATAADRPLEALVRVALARGGEDSIAAILLACEAESAAGGA